MKTHTLTAIILSAAMTAGLCGCALEGDGYNYSGGFAPTYTPPLNPPAGYIGWNVSPGKLGQPLPAKPANTPQKPVNPAPQQPANPAPPQQSATPAPSQPAIQPGTGAGNNPNPSTGLPSRPGNNGLGNQ